MKAQVGYGDKKQTWSVLCKWDLWSSLVQEPDNQVLDLMKILHINDTKAKLSVND